MLTPAPPEVQISATDARHPELERALHEAPDRENFLVYADWLQEQGDPLGELVALGVAVTDATFSEAYARFVKHLRLHEQRLLGTLATTIRESFQLSWRNGFVEAIQPVFGSANPPPALWTEVLSLRVCQLVDRITLQGWDPRLEAAIDAATPHLRHLVLSDCRDLPPALLKRDLRSLIFHGVNNLVLRPGSLPASLEHLGLWGYGVELVDFTRLDVRELGVGLTSSVPLLSWQLPRLERLLLSNVGPDVVGMVEALGAPALVHLTLGNGRLPGAALRDLAQLPIATRLRSLGLTSLQLTDEALVALARERGNLTRLAELDVSRNELTRTGVMAARELALRVISEDQDKPGASADRRLRSFAGRLQQEAEDISELANWREAGIEGEVRWARYREYELYVSADLGTYACSCASSTQPCKHVVALALVGSRDQLVEASSNGLVDRLRAL